MLLATATEGLVMPEAEPSLEKMIADDEMWTDITVRVLPSLNLAMLLRVRARLLGDPQALDGLCECQAQRVKDAADAVGLLPANLDAARQLIAQVREEYPNPDPLKEDAPGCTFLTDGQLLMICAPFVAPHVTDKPKYTAAEHRRELASAIELEAEPSVSLTSMWPPPTKEFGHLFSPRKFARLMRQAVGEMRRARTMEAISDKDFNDSLRLMKNAALSFFRATVVDAKERSRKMQAGQEAAGHRFTRATIETLNEVADDLPPAEIDEVAVQIGVIMGTERPLAPGASASERLRARARRSTDESPRKN